MVTIKNSFIPEIGTGIYTIADIGRLLNIPYEKAYRWSNEFWDRRFSSEVEYGYSYRDENQIVLLSFYSLIEFYIFYRLRQNGFSAKKIIEAHNAIGQVLNTPYPFASTEIFVDGGSILFDKSDSLLTADKSLQYGIRKLIMPFAKKIEFNGGPLAQRYWPLGKQKSILIDPRLQFGKPVIEGTRICPDIIYDYYKSGESRSSLISLFGLSRKQVNDAIYYCKGAA